MFDSMEKPAGDTSPAALHGRLILSKSGWLLLEVPNAIGLGAFAALREPGAEIPDSNEHGPYRAHISVMRPEDLEQIGGADVVTERGHEFAYSLGPIRTVSPKTWEGVSKVWMIDVNSPALEQLRRSYGLSGLPNGGEFRFHITFAIRKVKVLRHNDVTKLPQGSQLLKAGAAIKSALEARTHVPSGTSRGVQTCEKAGEDVAGRQGSGDAADSPRESADVFGGVAAIGNYDTLAGFDPVGLFAKTSEAEDALSVLPGEAVVLVDHRGLDVCDVAAGTVVPFGPLLKLSCDQYRAWLRYGDITRPLIDQVAYANGAPLVITQRDEGIVLV